MSDEPLNGHSRKPLSMSIRPQFDKDPLRPKKHQVVNSQGFIIATSTEPIELLKLNAAKQHAVFSPNEDIVIIDESLSIVHREESYFVEPEDGPPNKERVKIRDKWMDNVMRFLLPPGLYNRKDDPAKRPRLARWFKRNKIEISMRPDGGAVRVFRDGNVICSWGC